MISCTRNTVTIQKVWTMHWNLTNATEIINEIWSIPLFLWISKLFSSILSRAYAVLLKNEGVLSRDGLAVIGSFITLCIIIIFCHLVIKQVSTIFFMTI